MNYVNAEGYVSCTLMSQFGLTRVRNTKEYESRIVSMLRDGSDDFIYDEFWIARIVKVLRPNEILFVHKVEDYFKIKLSTYQQQLVYYKKWCVKHELDERHANSLRRFIKEVKVIWV